MQRHLFRCAVIVDLGFVPAVVPPRQAKRGDEFQRAAADRGRLFALRDGWLAQRQAGIVGDGEENVFLHEDGGGGVGVEHAVDPVENVLALRPQGDTERRGCLGLDRVPILDLDRRQRAVGGVAGFAERGGLGNDGIKPVLIVLRHIAGGGQREGRLRLDDVVTRLSATHRIAVSAGDRARGLDAVLVDRGRLAEGLRHPRHARQIEQQLVIPWRGLGVSARGGDGKSEGEQGGAHGESPGIRSCRIAGSSCQSCFDG